MCAARLRADEAQTTVAYFRHWMRSIREQTVSLDEPLYLAMSGARAHRIDLSSSSVDVCVERPDDVDEVWPQFIGYRHLVERVAVEYAQRLDSVWVFFSDADDMWAPTRYEQLRRTVERAHTNRRVTSVIDATATRNVRLDDAHTYRSTDDVERGIRERTVETQRHVHYPHEYLNVCARFSVVRDFFEQYEPILSLSFADRFFFTFVSGYHGATGDDTSLMSMWYDRGDATWSYFYRQHAASTSSEYVALATEHDIVEQNRRNIDFFVHTCFHPWPSNRNAKLDEMLHAIDHDDANATLVSSGIVERLEWWRHVAAPAIGDRRASAAVERLIDYITRNSRRLRIQ